MKLTVLAWLRDSSISLIGRLIEVLFRVILFLLPLGVYLFLVQSRKKASTIRNISVYTNDDSKWQHVFPGFILVSVDPNSFKKGMNRIKENVQNWVLSNKYILEILFMTIVVALMVAHEVWK